MDLSAQRFRLADGVRLERKPVLAGGKFRWGYVLSTPDRPEGTECGDLVAVLTSRLDGRTTAGEVISRLLEGVDPGQHGQVEDAARSAIEILYVDGALTY